MSNSPDQHPAGYVHVINPLEMRDRGEHPQHAVEAGMDMFMGRPEQVVGRATTRADVRPRGEGTVYDINVRGVGQASVRGSTAQHNTSA